MALELGVRSRRIIDSVSQRRVYRDVFEIGVVALAFLLYFLVRGSVVDRDAEALGNALDVIRVEKALGFYWEQQLNEALIGYGALIQFFNAVYFWMDFPLIVLLALWLYFFGHRHEYTIARDALLASGAIALVVYHLYCGMLLDAFAEGRNLRSHRWYRWFNEVPVLLLLAAVILVVVKPF